MRDIWKHAIVLLMMPAALGALAHAQERKPTHAETAAIRACAQKNSEDSEKAEQRCVFRLLATPCTNRPQGQTTVGMSDCYRAEQMVWDAMLGENLKALREELDDEQKGKLTAMQEAWDASRLKTCTFYHDKIQGSMATSMAAACMARESARRALLVRGFKGL